MGNKHNQAKRLAKKRGAVSKAHDQAIGSTLPLSGSRTPAQPKTTLPVADHRSRNDAAVKLTLRIPKPRPMFACQDEPTQDEAEPEELDSSTTPDVRSAVEGLLGLGSSANAADDVQSRCQASNGAAGSISGSGYEQGLDGMSDLDLSYKSDTSSSSGIEEVEDNDLEVFEIPFQIPHDGAVETVVLPSTVTFTELRRVISKKMKVDTADVKVGYKFSTDARSKAVNHLSDASHLRELFEEASDILRNIARGSRKNHKSLKVEIIHLVSEEKANKHSKVKDKKKKRMRGRKGSLSSITGSNDESIDDPKHRSEAQWVSIIQKANHCSECRDGKQACATLPGGSHGPLSKEDLSMWGLLCRQGYDSITVPPKQLRLMDRVNTRASSKETSHEVQKSSAVGHQHHHLHEPASPARTPYSRHHRSYSPYTPPHYYHPAWLGSIKPPSSPDMHFEPADDPTLFPHTVDWLKSLTQGPRGADGDDFCQFAPALTNNGYKRIFHLARTDFSIKDLRRICGEDRMSEGLASTLLDYARADTRKIVTEETRRRKRERNEPKRYI